MGNTTSNNVPFQITFTIDTDKIINDYNSHNSLNPNNVYNSGNDMYVNNSYYTIDPVNSTNPGTIDIGKSTSIKIILAVKSEGTGTLTLTQFNATDSELGTLVSDSINISGSSMTMNVKQQASAETETFDLNFNIESKDESGDEIFFWCILDPKLKANQGQ